MKRWNICVAIGIWTAAVLGGFSMPDRAAAGGSEKLIIFHAGSLAIPFKDMATAFESRHPDLRVYREAAGSRTCARKIVDLGRPCDVMASADYTVIEALLIPDHAEWNISFATNEMAVMYRHNSKYANEITGENWYRVLLGEGVEYGHSDPNADPCGYRSQLTWQLAEKHYGVPGLYKALRDKCPPRNVRPKETDLIALLEAGQIDYLFIYRSICEQHHMPFVILPDRINLKSAAYADFYRQASIEITGKEPGKLIKKVGKPMVYGMTIPKNAPNPSMAVEFAAFAVGAEGRRSCGGTGSLPFHLPRPRGTWNGCPMN